MDRSTTNIAKAQKGFIEAEKMFSRSDYNS